VKLTPRYGQSSIIEIDGAPDDQLLPVTRQRRRLLALLGGLSDEQWRAPTRCDGWSPQDVVAHLASVDNFWTTSVAAGLAGEPTRILENFDPQAHPPLLIAPMRTQPAAEVFEQFATACEGFLALLEKLDDPDWEKVAESPAGHVPIRMLAFHALWDAWIHERDIAIPLSLPLVDELDEVESALKYAAAAGPALDVSGSRPTVASACVRGVNPNVSFTLTVDQTVTVRNGTRDDTPLLAGPSPFLTDALSVRAPLPADAPAEWRELARGMATVFDAP
jgi:uncharacterized protein (TIGR03083 family)